MVLIKETLDASIIETETGEIRLNQYQIHDVIGSGSFGTVSLAIDVDTNKKYVINFFLSFILSLTFYT
jgi:serine/threonine protein kinase